MLDVLNPEELRRLTGYKQPSKQLSWLLRKGFKAIEGRDGTPVVLRSHIEAVLSPRSSRAQQVEPNLDALKALLHKERDYGETAKTGKRLVT